MYSSIGKDDFKKLENIIPPKDLIHTFQSEADLLKLEKIFSMSDEYVLDFSNSSFHRFIYAIVKLDINNSKYDKYGRSKAKQFHEWSLNNFIEVAYDIGYIGLD